jgi:hypothetical protein
MDPLSSSNCGTSLPSFTSALDMIKGQNTDPTSDIINGNVVPNLRCLLGSVLGVIDASIPNKDQNRAIKNLVKQQFDLAYMDILRRAYPYANFATDASLSPEMIREQAFASAQIQK